LEGSYTPIPNSNRYLTQDKATGGIKVVNIDQEHNITVHDHFINAVLPYKIFLQQGKVLLSYNRHGEYNAVSISQMQSETNATTIGLIDGLTNIADVKVSKDEQTLYIATESGHFLIYNITDLTHPIKSKVIDTKSEIASMILHPNGTVAYLALGEDGYIGVDLQKMELFVFSLPTIGYYDSTNDYTDFFALSLDGTVLFKSKHFYDGEVGFYDVSADGKTFSNPKSATTLSFADKIKFSSDGKTLYALFEGISTNIFKIFGYHQGELTLISEEETQSDDFILMPDGNIIMESTDYPNANFLYYNKYYKMVYTDRDYVFNNTMLKDGSLKGWNFENVKLINGNRVFATILEGGAYGAYDVSTFEFKLDEEQKLHFVKNHAVDIHIFGETSNQNYIYGKPYSGSLDKFVIYDIATEGEMKKVGSLQGETYYYNFHLSTDGSKIFAQSMTTIDTIDISNASMPTQLDTLDLEAKIGETLSYKNDILVMTLPSEIRIYDFSNPQMPKLLYREQKYIETTNEKIHLHLIDNDNNLYVTLGKKLIVIDLNDLENIRTVIELEFTNTIQSVLPGVLEGTLRVDNQLIVKSKLQEAKPFREGELLISPHFIDENTLSFEVNFSRGGYFDLKLSDGLFNYAFVDSLIHVTNAINPDQALLTYIEKVIPNTVVEGRPSTLYFKGLFNEDSILTISPDVGNIFRVSDSYTASGTSLTLKDGFLSISGSNTLLFDSNITISSQEPIQVPTASSFEFDGNWLLTPGQIYESNGTNYTKTFSYTHPSANPQILYTRDDLNLTIISDSKNLYFYKDARQRVAEFHTSTSPYFGGVSFFEDQKKVVSGRNIFDISNLNDTWIFIIKP